MIVWGQQADWNIDIFFFIFPPFCISQIFSDEYALLLSCLPVIKVVHLKQITQDPHVCLAFARHSIIYTSPGKNISVWNIIKYLSTCKLLSNVVMVHTYIIVKSSDRMQLFLLQNWWRFSILIWFEVKNVSMNWKKTNKVTIWEFQPTSLSLNNTCEQ